MIRVTMKEFANAVETYRLNLAEPIDYKKMKVTETITDSEGELTLLKPEDILIPEGFK